MSRRGSVAGIIKPVLQQREAIFRRGTEQTAADRRLSPLLGGLLGRGGSLHGTGSAERTRLDRAWSERGYRPLRGNVHGLDGLHALLATARNLDGHVYIACVPGGAIRRLFDVSLGTSTGSRKLFASRAEALAALRSLVPCGKQAAGVSGFRSRPSRLCRIALSW